MTRTCLTCIHWEERIKSYCTLNPLWLHILDGSKHWCGHHKTMRNEYHRPPWDDGVAHPPGKPK